MSKDYVMLQKEGIRVLVYDKTPDGESRQMMVNIVVGSQDMTLTRHEFHRLSNIIELVREAEKHEF